MLWLAMLLQVTLRIPHETARSIQRQPGFKHEGGLIRGAKSYHSSLLPRVDYHGLRVDPRWGNLTCITNTIPQGNRINTAFRWCRCGAYTAHTTVPGEDHAPCEPILNSDSVALFTQLNHYQDIVLNSSMVSSIKYHCKFLHAG